MPQQIDTLWRNARIATMTKTNNPYGAIEDGVLAAKDGRIAWVGPAGNAPRFRAETDFDLEGRWITPGLIDCHTHIVYGGNRAGEFEQRLQGSSYAQIAGAGGGIVSTVAATRAADAKTLLTASLTRVEHLIREGVTTLEVKSGYGLDTESEAKMLRVARQIGALRDITVRTTFLGAHALPPDADGDKEDYIDSVCREQLPAIADQGLADAVDAFCEGIAFSAEQTGRVFDTARMLRLPVKLHADQLSNSGGAALAAAHGALSADHLEYADDLGVRAMADSGTVAVLLPGAYYFLRDSHPPPVSLFRRHQVPMAVATDCNPGSSPLTSLLLAMNMVCTLFRLTPEEALAGVTVHAARALGMADEVGALRTGYACDLAVWDIDSPAELAYAMGFNPLFARIRGGCT